MGDLDFFRHQSNNTVLILGFLHNRIHQSKTYFCFTYQIFDFIKFSITTLKINKYKTFNYTEYCT